MPTSASDLKNLTKLGSKAAPSRTLEVFPNHAPGKLTVKLECTEFTCRCPLTGQPDYAVIDIYYVPDKFVVESKSLKLYLETFRDSGIFHEHLAVDIAGDFARFVKPLSVDVVVKFNVRGGIAIAAEYHWERAARKK
ncbi:MAG: NADPH-dependent 7-cyano-7-deazaguanine reductase [Candidatus Magasanikbacteria bacterium GW2011_GWA2_56_11]|uniref:NADPH-dependent 7-cyano-7-deazaguanine reductase n=1 Tax=Candidatus Magasanikbacteria bacterium GW2011_GWA2_56_11 TaxID=1619044 RepID=A0A0G1YCS8_9BACT|nr:MAG: NADPH-dependent 7-cyano-7-deazaguanine reductase [Candidatus Magasanikbacteria bacterium GW2011_GWA2_56_11]